MTENLKQNYDRVSNVTSDINMFIPVLKKYSEECNHVTEFGVRWIVSTWGLLAGLPKTLYSYDINHPSVHNADIQEVYDIAKENNIDYKFTLASTLEIDIEPTDLLFIDTDHTYEHLKKELNLHHQKVKKYIICHDTIMFKDMFPAITEFIENNKDWTIKEHLEISPGLIILEKIS